MNLLNRFQGSVAFASVLCLLGSLAHADAPQLRMYLKDGSFVDGVLAPSVREGHLGFQSELFDRSLDFDVRGIRSVAGEYSPEDQKSGHAFLLDGGTRITGDLKTWGEKALVVDSKSLGNVTIDRSFLRSVESVSDSGKRIYSGPKSIDDWAILDDTNKWDFAAGSLKSPDNEAKAGGKVDLPEKFRLSLSMSWEGRADFVMSLGCTEPTKPVPEPQDNNRRVRRAMVQPTQNIAAVRLEMWDAQLAVVREVGNLADIAVLPLEDDSSQFDLTFFVDQVAGLVAVYSPRGKLLEKIQVAEEKGKTNAFAMLENHGKSVSLDRFDVYEWDGHLPDSTEYPDSYVLDKDEKVVSAEVVGFDAKKRMLKLVDGEGAESWMKLADVRRVILAEGEGEGEGEGQGDEQEQGEDEPDEQEGESDDGEQEASPRFVTIELDESRLIEVDFSDTSRLIGYLAKSSGKRFGFKGNGIAGMTKCSPDQIVAVSGSAIRFAGEKLPGTTGTLTTDLARLKGSLVDSDQPEGDAVLVWQPWASVTRAAISQEIKGSIEYSSRRSSKHVSDSSTTRVEVQRRQPNNALGALIGGIFGNGGANPPKAGKKPAVADQTKSQLPSLEIVFRSGDTVDGVVQSVDDRGVTFASEETSTTFVPHEQMDSITLGRATSKPSFDEAELKRLLTVPRNQKSDPPTHLFVSTTGDYLRGRLVGVTPEVVGAEVRLEVQEIPRDKVARVIWLHERPWLDDEKAAKDKDGAGQGGAKKDGASKELVAKRFLVHAVRPDSRGVTFAPEKLVDGTLSGTSDLLGDCSVKLASIQSLLFGRDVGEKALALRKESWKLELAALPKAYLDDGEDDAGASAATSSPLVGKNAPEIKLQTINDVEFVLSENRDKVIVLDFWASWCGPCIATMPKVEEIIGEFDPHDVELVAVNLQDSVERARIALKRMDIEPTVVMDVDGETARFYDARAIPQTVIVDRNGKITHLFVGGGSKFLDQFSAALKEVVAAK